MELSILMAKIVAILYLSIGISIVAGQTTHKKLFKSYEESPGLVFISGFMLVILSALLIQYHNIWIKDWTVLITIIAWAMLIKGFLFLAFPKSFLSFGSKYAQTKNWMGYIIVVIALVFGYFGFMA